MATRREGQKERGKNLYLFEKMEIIKYFHFRFCHCLRLNCHHAQITHPHTHRCIQNKQDKVDSVKVEHLIIHTIFFSLLHSFFFCSTPLPVSTSPYAANQMKRRKKSARIQNKHISTLTVFVAFEYKNIF